jgi:AraC-type DNA-binding domain-containing proteins
MTDKLLEKRKIDPSESKQSFTDVSIRVHCCRYWILEEWECINMAFPFWRLYHNTKGNAMVTFNDTIHVLTAEKFIIIPPNTPFATCLKGSFQVPHKESIVGERILNLSELNDLEKQNKADHLFIHFNLGLIADTIKPGIYVLENTSELEKITLKIKKNIIRDSITTDMVTTMAIHTLILNLLSSLSPDLWSHQSIDHRVLMVMNYIEKNLGQKLNNAELAFKANMAKNSFARLFHKNTQLSLQEYIRKRRVECACNLMHHSGDSIELIALNCGFVDRHHFSRVFKKIMNITPAYYKKFHTIEI